MKPTIEELKKEQGFQHLLTVPFDKLLPFLFENMKPNTKTMGFFLFLPRHLCSFGINISFSARIHFCAVILVRTGRVYFIVHHSGAAS